MFDYLQKFNGLPKDLRDRVSSPSVMAAVSELENKYQVDLAMAVIKVMIKSLTVKDLPSFFISESGLAQERAENLTRDLKEKVFSGVIDYLGLTADKRALDLDRDIEVLIKDAGLVLASATLVSRFKNIVATYLRGVRSRIDTRNSLAKDVKIGGLNLSPAEIDRVLKICDSGKFQSSEPAPATPPPPRPAAFTLPPEEYDLKRALASGQVKSPVGAARAVETAGANLAAAAIRPAGLLDTKHEISAPEKQADLMAPAETVKPIEQIKSIEQSKPIEPAQPTITPIKPVAPPLKPAVAPVSPLNVRRNGPRPTVARRQAPVSSPIRPQMHDVKPMPKVMGPLEELQFLDLLNFRRLGTTPPAATAKIFAKIKLLEKDGYDKMVAGVRAWRQSPVNRLYLRLGQEALANGLTLKDAVAARQQSGQEFLSLEEIMAIVSLNGKLVF